MNDNSFSLRSLGACAALVTLVGMSACGSGTAGTTDATGSSDSDAAVGSSDASDGQATADAGGPHADGGSADSTAADTTAADTTAAGDTAAEDVPDTGAPACGYSGTYLVPGPCEPGFDEALAAKARRVERTWKVFNAAERGANTDISVALEDRPLVDSFVHDTDGWDFEAFSGKTVAEITTGTGKIAGLYAGVGIAADAYRYGVLRDQGYPAEEVDRARAQLLLGVEAFNRAATMPGVTGVIARSTDDKAKSAGTTPLFDAEGNPLPAKKNNGEWREDNSGQYPDHVWEDSCSRDYMLGWATAAGAAWEVMHDDDSFSAEVKAMLRKHAKDLGDALMVVRTDPAFCSGLTNCELGLGYDLQIPDADGRRTLHGCLNEHDLDCSGVIAFIDNGFNAVMALGFVATWAYVSGDPVLTAYLNDELIEARKLHTISRDSLDLVALGQGANWSGWNMAFGAIWLAQRYVFHAEGRAALRTAVGDSLYDIPGGTYLPVDVGYSYFDFIYAAGDADLGAGLATGNTVDQAAVDRGLATLVDFPGPPYWGDGVENCPESKCACASEDCPSSDKSVEVTECVAPDGTELTVLGCWGWKGLLITEEVVPMAIRPPSNYHWRSSPYRPNGGTQGQLSGELLPSVDFRIAYWTGRWAKVSD